MCNLRTRLTADREGHHGALVKYAPDTHGHVLARGAGREVPIRVSLSVIAVCLAGSNVAAQDVPSNGDLLRLIETQQRIIDEQGLRLDAMQRQLDDLRGQTVTPAVNPPPQGTADADPRGQRPEAPPDLVRAGDFSGSLTIPWSDAV